jgi:serine protease Do
MALNNDDNKQSPLANTDFISEKIKQRPINKKKLFRRTVITFALAVLFGIVACFTFLVLQPLFSDRLFPEKEPEAISFPA